MDYFVWVCELQTPKHEHTCKIKTDRFLAGKFIHSLRVAPSVKDERVYAIVAKSLLPYITSISNFWNVIYAKLFCKIIYAMIIMSKISCFSSFHKLF